MAEKRKYHTRQREQILLFFKQHPGQSFSAKYLIDSGEIQVGGATIYRTLAALAQEDILRVSVPFPGSAAEYEYVGSDVGHCRLTCVSCGGSEDVCCSFMTDISRHMRCDHEFLIDPDKTVIYGLCSQCSRKNGSEK